MRLLWRSCCGRLYVGSFGSVVYLLRWSGCVTSRRSRRRRADADFGRLALRRVALPAAVVGGILSPLCRCSR